MPSDTFNQISRVTNCFQAAWEFIRNPKKDLFVFFASEEAVKRTFEDANYSSVVKKLGPKQVRQLILNPQEVLNSTRPGDLVLIYMKMQSMAQGEFEALAHVSTIVEGNIVFEKQNPGSSYPYRLALASDSLLELASGDSSLETLKDFRVVIRRFNKKTLPSPQEAFNMQTAPGSFINIGHLDPAKAPSLDFQKNHSVVSELGSGGTIINESFYKIEKISVDHLLKAQP